MVFTKTMVDEFIHQHQLLFSCKDLRLGQMFYDHFKLHKTNDPVADLIYEADGKNFWDLLYKHTDWNN